MSTDSARQGEDALEPRPVPRDSSPVNQIIEFLRRVFLRANRLALDEEQRKHRGENPPESRPEPRSRRQKSQLAGPDSGITPTNTDAARSGELPTSAGDPGARSATVQPADTRAALAALAQIQSEVGAAQTKAADPTAQRWWSREPQFSASPEALAAAADVRKALRDTTIDEVGWSAEMRSSLEVHVHPTGRNIRAVRGPKRAAEKGTAITRIDRLAVDGMVFERRTAGGSILVDHSGSMSLSYEDVAQAIEEFPAVTIGRYSDGTLCVLADKGQLGELGDCTVGGGGNDVDIESLVWLSKQPEPRVWVSDGLVCGGLVEVLGSERSREVITSLCRRKGIVRVPTFEEGVKVLQRGAHRGTVVRPTDPDFVGSFWR